MTDTRQSESTKENAPKENRATVDRDPVATDESHTMPTTSKHPAGQEEFGGPKGLEPTRYGDWERKGRCIDF